MVKSVNYEEFVSEIANGTVFVDFYATWCGPCKMVAPIVEALSEELSDVKFLKVDVDQVEELAREFHVMSIPTLMIFKDGKLADTKLGFMPKEALINWINENK